MNYLTSALLVPATALVLLQTSFALQVPLLGPLFASPLPLFLQHSPNAINALGHQRGEEVYTQICSDTRHTFSKSTSENSIIGTSNSLPSLAPSSTHLNLSRILSDIVVDSNVHHGGWDYGLERLREMELCPHVFNHLRSFEFYIYHDGPPPAQLAPELVQLLKRATSLEKLLIVIPQDHVEVFAAEFEKMELTLPGVETLIVGPFMEWMVEICPNTKALEASEWWVHERSGGSVHGREHSMRLAEAAGKLTGLERFRMDERWTLDLLEVVFEQIPKVPNLEMPGACRIATLIPTLSHFPDLEHLELASSNRLDVGYHPPFCGNVYDNDFDGGLRRMVIREGEEADERVAKMVGPALQKLKTLSVGDRVADVLRDEEGRFMDVRWR